MRSFVLATLLGIAAPACLAAQPAPPADAPLPWHVTYLLAQARTSFSAVRREAATSTLASSYAIRFRGVDAASEILLNFRWNVMHTTRLPVRDGAGVQALWASTADSIGRVIPPGWQAYRRAAASARDVSHAIWKECANGGREVVLHTHAPYEEPALYLTVYQYDAPCSS